MLWSRDCMVCNCRVAMWRPQASDQDAMLLKIRHDMCAYFSLHSRHTAYVSTKRVETCKFHFRLITLLVGHNVCPHWHFLYCIRNAKTRLMLVRAQERPNLKCFEIRFVNQLSSLANAFGKSTVLERWENLTSSSAASAMAERPREAWYIRITFSVIRKNHILTFLGHPIEVSGAKSSSSSFNSLNHENNAIQKCSE